MFNLGSKTSHRVEAADSGQREELLRLCEGLKDVISLGRGDPDLDTPANIAQAGINAINEGHTHYTHWAGKIELRRLIAEKLQKDNGLNYDPESEIVVTVGGQEAMVSTMLALIEAGDEVIIADPHYTSYSEAIGIAGGKTVFVKTRPEDDFMLKADDIREKITDKTKLLVVITPNNPTGAMIPEAELRKIAALAIEKDLIVISDEIYEKIIFDDNKHFSIAALPGMKERTVVLNGFSKAYSMTGWRIGYFAAPKCYVQKLEVLIHSLCISVAEFVQYAAIEALVNGDEAIRRNVGIYDERRKALMAAFDKSGIKYLYPKSGLYMWIDIRESGLTSFEFAKKLLLEGRVLIFPGTVYGGGEGYCRVSLLAPTERLKEAAWRIESVFANK